MKNEKRTVFNIQRFCINDGPGIRTTVFLKGCMLKCLWCHNPESGSPTPQLMLHKSKCIGCGECMKACPKGLHSFDSDGKHLINRPLCAACGTCADACVGALEICGKDMTADEIITEVMKDESFYRNSGGGLTLSGGDPLFSPAFTLELLKKAKDKGLHTCIETCGHARWEDIEAILPYVDLFLWDVKETDSLRHKEYTGVSNERILDNLHRLNAAGAEVILRCPIIPDYNDREEHLLSIGRLSEALSAVTEVHIEPYHPMGSSKSEELGEEYPLKNMTFPEKETVMQWINTVASVTKKPVKKA